MPIACLKGETDSFHEANFTPATEFVLGYGGYLKKKGLLNILIKYDTLFIALQYMGMAIARRPYMGVGRNLAYRSATFFRMKGSLINSSAVGRR